MRADWTLLFYLLPYTVAVVFTLVSEQVSRRAEDLRAASLGQAMTRGQGAAIAAATGAILLLAASLYLVTPQLTWPALYWRYGQLSNLGLLGGPLERGAGGQSNGPPADGQAPPGNASAGAGSPAPGAGSGDGQAGEAGEQLSGSGWPTPAQMREAARRRSSIRWTSWATI